MADEKTAIVNTTPNLQDILNAILSMFGGLTPELQAFGKGALVAALDGTLTYTSANVDKSITNPMQKLLVNFAIMMVSSLRNSLAGTKTGSVGLTDPFKELSKFVSDKAKEAVEDKPKVFTQEAPLAEDKPEEEKKEE